MTDMAGEQEFPGLVDSDAPYGRKADGSPKEKPGRKSSATPGGTVPPPRAPRAAKTTSSRAKAGSAPDYQKGMARLLTMGVTALVVPGMRSDPLMADAATLAIHGPALIEAIDDLAQDDPRIAGVLDRLLAVGPYAALATAVVTIGVQLAANHGAIPLPLAGTLGARDPERLAASFRLEAQQMVAKAHPEAAAA